MRKKLVGITLLSASTFLLAGCSFAGGKDQQSPSVDTAQQKIQNLSAAQMVGMAMQQGKSVTCQIAQTDSQQTMQYHVKGKQFRMDTNSGSETTHIISDASFIYTWTEPSNQGTKMKLPDEDSLKQSADTYQSQTPDFSKEEIVNEYENQGYTLNCSESELSDSLFTPPSTVTFQDLSGVMEEAAKYQALPGNKAPQLSPEQQKQFEEALKQMGQ